jgi:two-component system CheB/CheR fusion protein
LAKAKRKIKKTAQGAQGLAKLPPIVGIGASAGGLEALGLFFERVPQDSGIAFILVQHLDPLREASLVEILQRHSTLKVKQAVDGEIVKPDMLYVIPPGKELLYKRGRLLLRPPSAPHGLRLPIDALFKSLAEEREEQALGVVLSGMGSDGTEGLRAIKEKGGAAFVQTPASAKFSGMPRSALDAGLADVVAPPEELPKKVLAYLLHDLRLERESERDGEQLGTLQKILALLRIHTGHDFSLYKKGTIYRRIERRMRIHQLEKIDDYVAFLKSNPRESGQLFKEMLIGVTSFFRDPRAWDSLALQVRKLLDSRPQGEALRAWCVACSSGEEAYSLAIAFKEAAAHLPNSGRGRTLQIFATDMNEEAIEQARAGVFPLSIAQDLSPQRLRRHFRLEDGAYQISASIREMVIFAVHDATINPPFSRMDIVLCRNLLIYFMPELQQRMIRLFHYSLKEGGLLMLGSAETVDSAAELFAPLDLRWHLYRRRELKGNEGLAELPRTLSSSGRQGKTEGMAAGRSGPFDPSAIALPLLLERHTPAAVLASKHGEILYVSGKTGRFLEAPAGKANWNLFAMAKKGLAGPLLQGFRRLESERKELQLRNIRPEGAKSSSLVDHVLKPFL